MRKRVKSTLFMSEETREKIRESGLSLEAYFNRLYEMHEQFTMDEWKDGYFSIGYFRVCLLRAETLNVILDHFDEDSLYKIGKAVGEQLRSTLVNGFEHHVQLHDESKMKMIDYFNRFSGWGSFTLEEDSIIVTMPVFTQPHFLQGYIEGLLEIELTTFESHPDRMAFKIR